MKSDRKTRKPHYKWATMWEVWGFGRVKGFKYFKVRVASSVSDKA